MPIYRLTTAETILRQYVIIADTEADALEDWRPGLAKLYEPQPVANPERVQHIEEDPPPSGLDCPRCGRVMAIPVGGGSECRYHDCRQS